MTASGSPNTPLLKLPLHASLTSCLDFPFLGAIKYPGRRSAAKRFMRAQNLDCYLNTTNYTYRQRCKVVSNSHDSVRQPRLHQVAVLQLQQGRNRRHGPHFRDQR